MSLTDPYRAAYDVPPKAPSGPLPSGVRPPGPPLRSEETEIRRWAIEIVVAHFDLDAEGPEKVCAIAGVIAKFVLTGEIPTADGRERSPCICGATVLPDLRERQDVRRLCCDCRALRVELIMAQRRRAA